MIPRSRKFPLRTNFFAFRKTALRLPFPLFTIHYSLTTQPARLAVVVPKKCARLATTRNWLKRLTYDTLWPLIQDKNLDVVVIYKPIFLRKSEANKQQIIEELKNLNLK